MPKLLKKIIASFLVSVILTIGITTPVRAQQTSPWYNQSYDQWSQKVFGGDQNEIFGERYTYAQVNWIINSLTAVITGSDISACVSKGDLLEIGKCMQKFAPSNPTASPSSTTAPSTPNAPVAPNMGMSGGAVGGLAFLTNTILNAKPASGIDYVKDTASHLRIIPQAYAQGVGFKTLSPVQAAWKVVRDISYALMVVVILVMAFMIMFRVKISPQVVISVQSALPKVVVALVLITFSYAIAGFLVDLMYVIVGVFAAIITMGGTTITSGNDIPYLFTQLTSGNGLWSIVIGIILFGLLIFVVGAFIVGASTITIPVLGPVSAVGILAGFLILVFGVVLLFILGRLFLLMVKTATMTILLIIVGPLMILMGALSTSGGFWSWIRTLAANLAVYPTVIIMVFLSHYFFWGWFVGGFLTGVLSAFTPFNTFQIQVWNTGGDAPIISLPGMPIRTNILGFVIAFVILFLIPKAADIIQSVITGKAFGYGAAIGEAFGPGIAYSKYGVSLGAAGEYPFPFSGLKKLPPIGPKTKDTIQAIGRALGWLR